MDIDKYNSVFRDFVRERALEAGFKLKPQDSGGDDLHGYVYSFAENLVHDMMTVIDREERQALCEAHLDDQCVNQFADVMKRKLLDSRNKGRSGWEDPRVCTNEYLADLLIDHLTKENGANYVDLANLAMMLHMRGATGHVLSRRLLARLLSR